MEQDNILHMLVLVDSSHDAEVLASTFRNAGFAVRSQHVEDEEALTLALKEKNWDILISAPKVADYTAQDAIASIQRAGKDVPCVVFGANPDKDTVLELMNAGAAHVVAAEDQDFFQLVVGRELTHLRDRRAHRRCRNMLAESEKRNRVLLDSSRDAIAYIHEGMHIYANESYLQAFGYDGLDEVESMPIMDMICGEDQQAFKELLRTLSKGETPESQFEFTAERADGEQFKAVMAFSTASIDGETCTQVVIHRQSDNKELEKELDQLRKQDLLTGLYNRQHFMDELATVVGNAGSGKHDSVLMYIEPDNFKAIQDTLGVAGSDIVLGDMANMLREKLGEKTILARFAGTIFTAIVAGRSTDEIEPLAEELRAFFEQHIFEVEGKTVDTTCSIGISPITEATPDTKQALNQAEGACGMAKKDGGNRVHVHTVADQLASLEEERAWVERLRLSLKNNNFTLHYQPIVSLHAEPGERYEVLLRMLNSDGKTVMPKEFMGPAENAKLMNEIDKWVMKSAAKAALEQRRDGKEIQFFIKLSADTVEDPGILPWISKLLKAARLHGASFVFEISESIAINNLKTVKAIATGLKQLHCLFALDHVGLDNNFGKYLEHLPIDYIKIDGSHIHSLTGSENSQETVRAITEIARNREIQTIAEHVQDPACLAVLWQHGVNFIQGHYLQKPEGKLTYDFSSEQ